MEIQQVDNNLMKLISLTKTLIFVAVILLMQSCDGVVEDINPADNLVNRLKWSYDFETVMGQSLNNEVPAIDENGNIYAIADVQAGGKIFKLSSDGTELWSITESEFPLSRVIYFEDKIFYNGNNELVCRNAGDGTKLWTAPAAVGYKTMALNNGKIYTGNFVDGGIFGNNYSLLAYDLSGNLIWEEKIRYSENDTITYPNAISVNGNNIYLGIFVEVNNSDFAVINYVDNGNTVTKQWTWLAPEDYSVGGANPRIKDFSIDNSGNLLFGMENNSTQYVFSLNTMGVENWRTASTISEIISNVAVDANGDSYVAFDKVEKINSGGIVWSSEPKKDWEYSGLISQSPVLSQNGDITYSNYSQIMESRDKNNSKLWEQYYGCGLCNNIFDNITINRNGDIILISKAGLYCFKGNGSALSESGWPKPYGDYGNTSGK